MLAIDWGTSSLRAYRLDLSGEVCETRQSEQGILKVKDGRFADALEGLASDWIDAGDSPIVMSGMIGSRQGWKEAAYIPCPAGFSEVATAICGVSWNGPKNQTRNALIVPGLVATDACGHPDVMRGEETQIFGIIDELGLGEHRVCLPGTHSKWVTIRDERIVNFQTHMTGEVFAVLKQHSILGRTMSVNATTEGDFDEDAYMQGVLRTGERGGLLNHLFSVRSNVLLGKLEETHAASFLSGILIGHELRSATDTRDSVHLMGNRHLTRKYALAATALGIHSFFHDENAVTRGLFKVAQHLPAGTE